MGDRERKSSPHHKGNEVWVCGMSRMKEFAVLIYMRDSATFPYMTMRVYPLDKASSGYSGVPFTRPRRREAPIPGSRDDDPRGLTVLRLLRSILGA